MSEEELLDEEEEKNKLDEKIQNEILVEQVGTTVDEQQLASQLSLVDQSRKKMTDEELTLDVLIQQCKSTLWQLSCMGCWMRLQRNRLKP